jgi:predicted ATP-grasp superfamily ATP-dependent carboligase
MEINGRAVIYNALLRRAGLDVAGLAWSELATGRAEPSLATGWSGAWIHLHADVLYSLLDRRRHPLSLSEFFAPYRRRKVFAVWSARDPLPFLTEWARTARRGIPALLSGAVRARVEDHAMVSTGTAPREH